MAAIQAIHDTMKALREGTPADALPGLAGEALMKQVTRDAAYRDAMRRFLGG